ncbi:MAG: hypothetical protein DI628_06650 [Blastochloris viridis]|uniref:Uncharacterized protein n=1 Tax=Blastochloris viridis TaxID=1079 RepID=A0A6N4RBZ8_BLAVI|nr:MAG: hypothetical protein DI628_06650 [Blastochloris viridis]
MKTNVQEIELPELVDSLRALRKSPTTQLAKLLETAATQRRSGPRRRSYNDQEWNMQLGHGYTRSQQANGSFKSAISRNRKALQSRFKECLPLFLKEHWYGLMQQTIEAISRYGIERTELEAMIPKQVRQDVQKALQDPEDEVEMWKAYKPKHRQNAPHHKEWDAFDPDTKAEKKDEQLTLPF